MQSRELRTAFVSQLCHREDGGEEPFSQETTPSPRHIHTLELFLGLFV